MKSSPETIEFHYLWSFSVSSSTFATPTFATISIDPTLDPRIQAIAEYWQYFRFVAIDVVIHKGGPNATWSSAVDHFTAAGYNPRVPNTAPTTYQEVVELQRSVVSGFKEFVPTRLTLRRKDLLGDVPLKWYQTVAGTEDTQWEKQGVIYIASTAIGAATSNMLLSYEIKGRIEFMGRSLATITPMVKQPLMVKNDAKREELSEDFLVVGGVTYKKSTA